MSYTVLAQLVRIGCTIIAVLFRLRAVGGGALLIGFAAISAADAAPTQGVAPLVIRVGWTIAPAELTPLLTATPGVMKHNGVSYDLQAVHFSGTSAMIAALAAGELDVAGLGYSSFTNAVVNAGMTDLRVFADGTQEGSHGYFSAPSFVRNDDTIKSINDLKGRILAVNMFGSGTDTALRAILREHNIDDKKDVTIIEVGFPNMEAMLKAHKVDLISTPLPFSESPSLRQFAHVLFRHQDAFGPTQTTIWAAREEFIAAHHAQLVDLMEDTIRAVRWYSNPANHRKVVEICAAFTKQPPALLDGWLFTKKDYFRDQNGVPDIDIMQKNIDLEHQLGFLKSSIDLKNYVDLEVVHEAAQRLQ